MTDTSGPWGTNPWTETQWYRFASAWAPDGVLGPNDLLLTSSGLSVTLGVGRAWVHGAGYERVAPVSSLTVAANNDSTNYRRDRIVLRRSLSTHTVTPVVIQGTPSATPVPPTPTQNDSGDWDVLMWSFLVPPGGGTSISGVIDERATVGAQTVSTLRITSTTDAKVDSVAHPFQIGPDNGPNLRMDGNEIIAVNNGALSVVGTGGSPLDCGTPLAPTHAATKAYVDALGEINPTPGHTLAMRDALGKINATDPTVSTHVTTKAYVDTLQWTIGTNYTAATDAFHAKAGWEIVTAIVQQLGPHLGYALFQAKRVGADIPVSVTGNVGNVDVAQVKVGYEPVAHNIPLQTSSTGRMCMGYMTVSGVATLVACAPGASIKTGEIIELACPLYRI